MPIIFSSLPLSLISGPFIPGFLLVIISLYFFFNFKNIYNKIVLKLFWIFILFYLYLIFNSLISISPTDSFKSSSFYLRFILFLFSSLYILNKFESKVYLYLLYSLLISFGIVFISVLFEFSLSKLNLINSDGQFTGVFLNEKISGSYTTKFYPLLIGLILYLKNYFPKIKNQYLIFIIFYISWIIVILSGERTAFFSFILINFLLLILIEEYRNVFFKIKNLLFLILTLIIFLSLSNNLYERLIIKTKIQLLDNNQIKLFPPHHKSHYVTAIKMFNKNIFFGIGPRMFRDLCDDEEYESLFKREISMQNNGDPLYQGNRIIIKEYNGCSIHPHNTILQIMSEIGLIGFLFFLIFLIYLYLDLFRYLNRKYICKSDNILFRCSIVSLIVIFFPLLPSNNFFGSYINIIYFYLFSIYIYERSKIS